ncbi:MAG: hypothetical protein WCJ51_03570 [Candidatus Moraniibacteriota bacterium]
MKATIIGTGFLMDTSFDYSLMQELTGVHPLSVKESFDKYA